MTGEWKAQCICTNSYSCCHKVILTFKCQMIWYSYKTLIVFDNSGIFVCVFNALISVWIYIWCTNSNINPICFSMYWKNGDPCNFFLCIRFSDFLLPSLISFPPHLFPSPLFPWALSSNSEARVVVHLTWWVLPHPSALSA